ncbi:C-type lectin domain family 4 member E [Cyprinodon tularosa]|uniref:C-type lectin domain family 4 member E n=1 Tax=Cyprinodon tularosa TaxID=77115 RepID=UPI0018E1EBC9|nr:C-type lectin domain family 4 member E [Cyprinodon tularosa]
MATTGSSSTDRIYSKLIDEGSYDQSNHRTDVQHINYPVSPVRNPWLSGPGPYRFATICLAALSAILLISIIAITARNKNKSASGVEATAEMQRQNANISAVMQKLQSENKQQQKERDELQKEKDDLQREKDELQAKLDSILTTKAITPTPRATAVPIVCPTNWHLFENSCYLITAQNRQGWSGSNRYCQTQGAHLAIILTAEEQTFLWNLLPRGHWNAFWFGITDGETEDEWKWVDGTPVEGGFWEENEPNNHINEDCGYIVKTQVLERVATKSWYDAPCSMPLPFICEKEMRSTSQ